MFTLFRASSPPFSPLLPPSLLSSPPLLPDRGHFEDRPGHFFTYLWALEGTSEGQSLRASLRVSWESSLGCPDWGKKGWRLLPVAEMDHVFYFLWCSPVGFKGNLSLLGILFFVGLSKLKLAGARDAWNETWNDPNKKNTIPGALWLFFIAWDLWLHSVIS